MMPKLPDGVDEKYWKELKTKFINNRGKTSVRIQKIPIGDGKTSYAFKIYDDEKDCEMVGKIDKKVLEGYSKKSDLESA
jgi:hypothetical protein